MNRMFRASLGMGVSVLLAAGLAAQEPSQDPNLVVNGSFEVFESTTTGGLPGVTGDWTGDATEIVDAVPVEGGVMPMDGAQMLRFVYTYLSPSAGSGSELWQSIDVTAFRAEIDAGRATASARAFFNRLHRDATTDTQFVLQVFAFSGNPATFLSQLSSGTDLTMVMMSVFTDADPASWEEASLEFVLPPNTDFLGLLVASIENVSNNSSGVEFHGHYVDAVSVNVMVEPVNQAPSSQCDAGPHVAVVGEPFSHSMQGSDPNANDTLAVSFDFTPPGATWSPANGTVGTSPVDATFDWTPTSVDVGQWDLAAHFTDGSGAMASCPFTVMVNHRPEAEIAHERLPDADGLCHIALDGSGSFDLNHGFAELTFGWTVMNSDGAVVMEMAGASHDDVALVHGRYTVALVVTDPLSTAGEASVELMLELEPEEDLAEITIRRAHVHWRRGRISMSGKVELPMGVDPATLDPTMAFTVTLAGQEVWGGWLDGMRVRGNRWRLHRHGVDSGVSKFAMRWRDARYALRPDGLRVLIRNGEHSEKGSTFRIYTKRHLKSAVTIDFDGRATVTLGRHGDHSSQGEVEIESRRHGRLVLVHLPFEMAMDSKVKVSSGETSLTRLFGDDWTPSTGRFYVRVKFDGSAFPDRHMTEPRVMDCGMLLGSDGPIGAATLDLHRRGSVWLLPKHHDDHEDDEDHKGSLARR